MPGPRKPETIRLELARRQVFQWHFRENLPLPILKRNMDQLSLELVKITGESFIASEGVWEGRICYWNRRSPKSWNINKRQRGPDVPIPADLVGVRLWRAWDADVGDWAIWKHSQLAKHNLLDVPRNPSVTVSDASHSMFQPPAGDICYWKAQEGQDWGLSSNSHENGTSNVPLTLSGTSRSTGSFSNESIPQQAYLRDAATDDTGSTSWLSTLSEPWHNIFPPQLPYTGVDYDGQQVFCDESVLSQPPADVPRTEQAGFSYQADASLIPPTVYVRTSYMSPSNYDSSLTATSIQTDPRQLYIPPEPQSSEHQLCNPGYDVQLHTTMASPWLNSLSAPGILRLHPRDTVWHIMNLYGGRMPGDGFMTPAKESKDVRSHGRP